MIPPRLRLTLRAGASPRGRRAAKGAGPSPGGRVGVVSRQGNAPRAHPRRHGGGSPRPRGGHSPVRSTRARQCPGPPPRSSPANPRGPRTWRLRPPPRGPAPGDAAPDGADRGVEFGGPRFTLCDPVRGAEIPVRGVTVPTRTASFSRARVSLACFRVDPRGSFEPAAEGMPDDPHLQLVLTRPPGATPAPHPRHRPWRTASDRRAGGSHPGAFSRLNRAPPAPRRKGDLLPRSCPAPARGRCSRNAGLDSARLEGGAREAPSDVAAPATFPSLASSRLAPASPRRRRVRRAV